jgi:hypothetical protein
LPIFTANHVGAQINAQNCDSVQWQWDADKDVDEEGQNLGNVGCERVGNGLLQIIKYESALLNTGNN